MWRVRRATRTQALTPTKSRAPTHTQPPTQSRRPTQTQDRNKPEALTNSVPRPATRLSAINLLVRNQSASVSGSLDVSRVQSHKLLRCASRDSPQLLHSLRKMIQ